MSSQGIAEDVDQIVEEEEDDIEDIIEKTGADKQLNERVFNYKVLAESTREIEIKGVSFLARFYKTSAKTKGIRVPLADNGPLFERFLEYCREISDLRIEKEKEAKLIAFTAFGKQDKGLEFFPVMGFYVFPFDVPGKEPHLVFNQEKEGPTPQERLEAFVEYYRKKLGIQVKPKKGTFESLRSLDLTEI